MRSHTGLELEGSARARPVRVAFILEMADPNAQTILDAVFANCYARWGGRFDLIVPCARGRVVPEYWPWLQAFDPDLIYSYSALEDDEVLRLHEELGPSDLVVHRIVDDDQPTVRAFRPDFRAEFLSCLSTVFRLARHSPSVAGPRVRILDAWHTEKTSRFFGDNFGTYLGSRQSSGFPNDAKQAAGLVTVVSDEFFGNRKYGVPPDLDRVADEGAALVEFARRRATSMSLLSAMHTPRLEVHDWRWSGGFSLVVGETAEDRLLFWNARLLIPHWLDSDLCTFRVGLAQLRDLNDREDVCSLLNTRNHVTGPNNGQPVLRVRSASLSDAELAEAEALLSQGKVWSLNKPAERIEGGHVIPNIKAHRDEPVAFLREPVHLVASEWVNFRWTPPTARPPAVEPEHLRDAPAHQAFAAGFWATDLSFMDGATTRIGRDNRWALPRRWRIARAFRPDYQRVGPGLHLSLQPAPRSTQAGNLTLFAALDQRLDSVEVPSLRDGLWQAFCVNPNPRIVDPSDPPWPTAAAMWIKPSNEDQHLTGVLGLAGGLQGAVHLLLHPFLKAAFAALGAAPNLAHTAITTVTNTLLKRAKGRPQFDLNKEDDLAALAALVVKTAQSVRAPMPHLSLSQVKMDWEAYRSSWWENHYKEHPQERKNDDAEGTLHDNWEARSLDEALVHLRMRGMLFQGYPWRCDDCGHRNWTDFQYLRATLSCEVCHDELPLPVDVPWHFRANTFLVESLRGHSVLSLVWALAALHSRAFYSFMYVGPTCFGWTPRDDALLGQQRPDAEADLLVIIDGEAVLCEVKSSWASVRGKDVEDLVSLAKRLRPDKVVLAVMDDDQRLQGQLQAAKDGLMALGIKFDLLTPKECPPHDSPFLRVGGADQ